MTGRVLLVGAGPGDPELLTVKALQAIRAADVVVFDRLVSAAILDLVAPGIEMIDVGKRSGRHTLPQAEINALLVRLGRSGRLVVRLKGGDPFLFGRGGEEALALHAAGVPFAVVPGITSAQGCAAALNLPLTHRNLATGVRFITGQRCGEDELAHDWAGLADANTTLVVYMGLANIGEIAARLMSNGLAGATPVVAISQGTQPGARHIVSNLGEIAEAAVAARLASPALFVIGKVARIAETLNLQAFDGQDATWPVAAE
jgi:uroporphyrin-III C-methyltransferase